MSWSPIAVLQQRSAGAGHCKILVFAGSLRTGAYSDKTADAAMKELALQGAEVTRISLADYPLPIMDQDLEKEKGVPENAVRLARLIAGHDGVLIATPGIQRHLSRRC